MTVAVIIFPGTNCGEDCGRTMNVVSPGSMTYVWHQSTKLPKDTTGIILPGGFSYGDYYRAGAVVATTSNIIPAIKRFGNNGGKILGVCNGFQILCETGMLPGVLTQNYSGMFICDIVGLSCIGGGKGLLKEYKKEESIILPVAHKTGRYIAEDNMPFEKIALTYTEKIDNGSQGMIAGIFGGPENNILGMMPHPERHSEERLGGIDGFRIMEALL